VEEINEGAFCGCSRLNSIDIENGVKKIGEKVFKGCSLEKIKIPESVTSIGEETFEDCLLKKFFVDKSNSVYFSSEDGILYQKLSKNEYKLIKYPQKKSGRTIVEKGTTTIERHAFKGATKLNEIKLSNEIKQILTDTFPSCSHLKTIILPDSTNYSIESNAFKNCESLKRIYSPAQTIQSIKIDEEAFNGIKLDECILYVPSGTRRMYEEHPYFQKFNHIKLCHEIDDLYQKSWWQHISKIMKQNSGLIGFISLIGTLLGLFKCSTH
jgi:hypothetical protein